MKGEIVLYQNNKALKSASNEIIRLTFLTTQHSQWTLMPLMAKTYRQIKKLSSSIGLYSLNLFVNNNWRPGLIWEEMPGFELMISFVDPLKIKLLCMPLELNAEGERTSDIDVYVYHRDSRQRYKVSHKVQIEDLVSLKLDLLLEELES